jgi:hypothetical protein
VKRREQKYHDDNKERAEKDSDQGEAVRIKPCDFSPADLRWRPRAVLPSCAVAHEYLPCAKERRARYAVPTIAGTIKRKSILCGVTYLSGTGTPLASQKEKASARGWADALGPSLSAPPLGEIVRLVPLRESSNCKTLTVRSGFNLPTKVQSAIFADIISRIRAMQPRVRKSKPPRVAGAPVALLVGRWLLLRRGLLAVREGVSLRDGGRATQKRKRNSNGCQRLSHVILLALHRVIWCPMTSM